MIRFGLFSLLLLLASSFVEPSKKQIPAHFVRISFYRYLQQHETTFKEWKTFMNYMTVNKGDREDRYLPNFEQVALDWKTKRNLNEMFEKGQLDSLPVVGIRYEDVLRYVNYKNELDLVAQKTESDFKRLKYFLPTPEIDTLLGKLGTLLPPTKMQKATPNAFPVLPVTHSCGKTKSGIYFYHQNVAEMSEIKGIALRGSYKTGLKDAGLGSTQNYYVPSGFIGFRLWAEVVEE
jgi:hypothetical protein